MAEHTLAEALAEGRGIERPFLCPTHEDTHASASVNVEKMVWVCYTCGASGRADKKKSAPSAELLLAMLHPERIKRIYPESWLEVFALGEPDDYWSTRFPDWVRWHTQLGSDPVSGDPMFAVRTRTGQLAGIARRPNWPKDQPGPKYIYPYAWSASRCLGTGIIDQGGPLCLVEGRSDVAALTEVGIPSACLYGSGLHLPQLELIARLHPSVVLVGTDTDEAGINGARRARWLLESRGIKTERIYWNNQGADDAAGLFPHHRWLCVSVRLPPYGDKAAAAIEKIKTAHRNYLEDHCG